MDDTVGGAPTPTAGAVAGVLATLAFVFIHDVFILDIWFTIAPMLISGALCGLTLAWSYRVAVQPHSLRRWLGWNGAVVVLLSVLGVSSFLIFEPSYSMAELLVADDPLGDVLPPAMPLLIVATLAGTLAMWAVSGRKPAALAPILVTQALIVLLVGHNLAILGMVDMSGAVARMVGELALLIAFLAGGFAVATIVVQAAFDGLVHRQQGAVGRG
jgi:hypothetical protein